MTEAKNEIGKASPRGRPRIPNSEGEADLSRIARTEISLGDGVIVSGSPSTCPACGAHTVIWAYGGPTDNVPRERIHPVVWHDTENLANSYICESCSAGWIEPDDPEPITWVRPWWIVVP
jgi:hypothetical protein